MIKILLFIVLVILILSPNNYSQDIYSEQPVVTVNLKPIYESWTIKDSTGFSEFTSILSAGYNPFKNTSLGLVTRYAVVSGDVGSLNGFSDLQFIVRQSLPKINVFFDGGVNIPTGKTKLDPGNFITSRFIGKELFSVNTSNFGQGLNAFLGVTWLHPLFEDVVIGAGISYQLKTQYQPLLESPEKYTPSNEISATAGLDIKLSETMTITGDFTGIFYGSDKLDGNEIFSSGSRLIFNTMYKQFFGFNYLSIQLFYRNVALGELKGSYALLDNEKINPNQVHMASMYNQRFNSSFSFGYGIFMSIYERTADYFSGYTLYGVTLAPQFKLSSLVSLPVFLKYAFGIAKEKSDLQNFEVSAGIKLSL